jgi:class 3 adenylate cyclase
LRAIQAIRWRLERRKSTRPLETRAAGEAGEFVEIGDSAGNTATPAAGAPGAEETAVERNPSGAPTPVIEVQTPLAAPVAPFAAGLDATPVEAVDAASERTPQRSVCTVIHCELTNHATLVNAMSPSEFTNLLNKVIHAFEEMVSARGGVCDRLSSDALRAFFQTPPTDPAQGQNALHCALSLKNRFSVISQACELKSGIELDMRIGVNTGEMVIAQFGGGSRNFFGVAGEAAEWGGRLASANLLYGSRILIGASSHLLAGEGFEARPIDLLQRELPPEAPEAVFELLANKGALSLDALERLNRYREGVALFRERRWQEAAVALRAARPPRSNDDAIDLLLHRIREQETLAEFPI